MYKLHVINLTSCSPFVAIKQKTMQELWKDSLADYFMVRIFSYPFGVFIENNKLEP